MSVNSRSPLRDYAAKVFDATSLDLADQIALERSADRTRVLRLDAWASGFGASDEDAFDVWCRKATAAGESKAIIRDVPRTYADQITMPLFTESDGAQGRVHLQTLLHALKARIGFYCQGLNFVAAHVLSAHAEPRDYEHVIVGSQFARAFGTLVAATTRFRGIWAPGLPLANAAVATIDALLRATAPNVADHLAQHASQSLGEVARAWCLTLFAHPSIPLEWRLWLWDLTAAACAASDARRGADADGAASGESLGCAVCAVVAVAQHQQERLLGTTDAAQLQDALVAAWSTLRVEGGARGLAREAGRISEHLPPQWYAQPRYELYAVSSGHGAAGGSDDN